MPRHDSIQLTEVSLVPSVPLRQHRSSTIHVITSSSTRFCTCKSFKWNDGELRAHPRERRSFRISCYTLTWLMASTNMLRRQLEATVIVPQFKQLQNVYIDHYIWPASLIKILSEIKTVAIYINSTTKTKTQTNSLKDSTCAIFWNAKDSSISSMILDSSHWSPSSP